MTHLAGQYRPDYRRDWQRHNTIEAQPMFTGKERLEVVCGSSLRTERLVCKQGGHMMCSQCTSVVFDEADIGTMIYNCFLRILSRCSLGQRQDCALTIRPASNNLKTAMAKHMQVGAKTSASATSARREALGGLIMRYASSPA